ncbi:hypothetical protein JL39_23185 [Rhizobium sp. YS-1r]|nr:hypothetical protein JL39_23185 [Rhizobium sp. YS-1r]
MLCLLEAKVTDDLFRAGSGFLICCGEKATLRPLLGHFENQLPILKAYIHRVARQNAKIPWHNIMCDRIIDEISLKMLF